MGHARLVKFARYRWPGEEMPTRAFGVAQGPNDNCLEWAGKRLAICFTKRVPQDMYSA